MKITVIGTGYVGLVTGSCLAQFGNSVVCIDTNEKKIHALNNGDIPIYEPGLEELIAHNRAHHRLSFSCDLQQHLIDCDIIFIAVGTPPQMDGSADMKYVYEVAKQIGQGINKHMVIVNKSTVPVGTADAVEKIIVEQLQLRQLDIAIDVVSNPEFLKEGNAIEDCMRPDRIIIGSENSRSIALLQKLYAPFMRNHNKIILMDKKSAELTKYAANSMLATRISFMNEIANLADIVGADIESVRQGIGSDPRIGFSFLYAGAGYGGSCFPKDVSALIHTGKMNQYDMPLLQAVQQVNKHQPSVLVQKIIKHFGEDLSGMTFTAWGLSFKPGTDDMRCAPSIDIICQLVRHGARIVAFDPVANHEAATVLHQQLPSQLFQNVVFADDAYKATHKSDALILITEWKLFQVLDSQYLKQHMKQHIIFDGRNIYDPQEMKNLGFTYYAIGRQ